jgi:hypothetical protein
MIGTAGRLVGHLPQRVFNSNGAASTEADYQEWRDQRD